MMQKGNAKKGRSEKKTCCPLELDLHEREEACPQTRNTTDGAAVMVMVLIVADSV